MSERGKPNIFFRWIKEITVQTKLTRRYKPQTIREQLWTHNKEQKNESQIFLFLSKNVWTSNSTIDSLFQLGLNLLDLLFLLNMNLSYDLTKSRDSTKQYVDSSAQAQRSR